MRDRDFERLFAEHAEPLFGFLVYRTGDRALTEDLLADTFERALRGRKGFDRRRGSEKGWLYAIALNCLRDHVRRAEVEERSLERVGARADGGSPAVGIEQADLRDQVGRLMALLPAEEREAVALRYGADMTVPEIAKLLGVPLTTAEGRVYRGLRRLREGSTGDTGMTV
jgi:RNA polymerase sigma factor (sigma-70 family)